VEELHKAEEEVCYFKQIANEAKLDEPKVQSSTERIRRPSIGKILLNLATMNLEEDSKQPEAGLHRNAASLKGNQGFNSQQLKNFFDFVEYRMLQKKKSEGDQDKINAVFVTKDMYRNEQNIKRESLKSSGKLVPKKILKPRTKRSKATKDAASSNPTKNTQLGKKKVHFGINNTVFVFPRDG